MNTIAEAMAASAKCPHCGVKMWPAKQLELHLKIHELKTILYRGQVVILQKTFKAMRNGAGWEW